MKTLKRRFARTGSLEIGSTGWLQAEKIVLGNGSDGKAALTNSGIIDIGEMSSMGGNTVTNNALLKINRAYTYNTAATQTDTYSGDANGVLISGQNSTAGVTSRMSGGAMVEEMHLATATTAAIDTASEEYYYTNYLNELCVEYLNRLAQRGDVGVTFSKDAVVQSKVTVTLNQNTKGTMTLNLVDHTIQIAERGTLVLAADVNITSTSETATIALNGGHLQLGMAIQ